MVFLLKDVNDKELYDEHLMSQETLGYFFQEMWTMLEKHKSEKIGIRNWEPLDVYELCRDEIRQRAEIISSSDPDEVRKQCIHIANYCYFLWQKMIELRESQKP